MTNSASPLASKAVLAVMFAALLGMFAWSFAYRAANPSLVATVQRNDGPHTKRSRVSFWLSFLN